MAYVDGYVLPVPKKELATYKKMASVAAKAWIECGALEYRECVLDDANVKFGMPFPKGMKLKKSEIAIFAWIMFKSRKHRDKVNAAVMKHPSIQKSMELGKTMKMPFEPERMMYGGFAPLVMAG
jgi:uncharacterized protein YbaA (DUF1428 family)